MNLLKTVFHCDAPVALVTGSGSPRVGRAIATELARHGCRIALHANTSVDQANDVATQLADRFGTRSIVTSGPLDQDDVPERLVGETVEAFGRFDILVNSAAIWLPVRVAQGASASSDVRTAQPSRSQSGSVAMIRSERVFMASS